MSKNLALTRCSIQPTSARTTRNLSQLGQVLNTFSQKLYQSRKIFNAYKLVE